METNNPEPKKKLKGKYHSSPSDILSPVSQNLSLKKDFGKSLNPESLIKKFLQKLPENSKDPPKL
jgi:hypothetical protein